MRFVPVLSLVAAAAFGLAPAQASVTLLAKGTLSGTSDLSGLSGTLEDGLAKNVLGGVGSAIAYAGGNTFLVAPDRGPNATSYNSAVDDTVSYISRFHTLTMTLTANNSGSGLAYNLTPTLTATTLLSSPTALTYGSGAAYGLGSGAPSENTASRFYFTGRSDNFGPGNSGVATNARFDPEGMRVSNDGLSVFVSDEYGPYVRQFDRATGQLVRTYTLPSDLDVANLSAKGETEISGNTSGRTANKGMEGLAITPDGKTLVGIMQAGLIQDSKKNVRLVTIDIATGATKEFGYKITNGSGVSEIVAINDHEFLVDERDGAGKGGDPLPASGVPVKQIFKIDISGATAVAVDQNGRSGPLTSANYVTKSNTPFLDIAQALIASGVPADQIPSKIEGISFGQDLLDTDGSVIHTLFISNDNDFLPDPVTGAGPNQFFVFGFKDGDLPGYAAQRLAAVPEPATWAMSLAGFALLGGVLRRGKRQPVQA